MGTEFRARSKVEEYLERQQTYGDSTIGAVGVAEEHRPQVCPTAANKTIRASERRSGLSPQQIFSIKPLLVRNFFR